MVGDIMAQLIKGIVDTQKNNYRSIGQVTAADDLELELEIKMNGQPIEFINPQAELLIKKSDNNRIRQTKDILYQDGKFKIKVDEQGVTYPGIVTCQLVTKENGRVSTCLFYFIVGTSLDREVLQSISKVEVLEQLDEYVATAFANLDEYEKRIIAGDETIRKLNNDMNEAEKIRGAAELERQKNFRSLKENMNEAITNLESSINLSNLNEKERGEVFNSLKSNLESIKQDLINLNASVESEEEKRVQAEINRVNKALEIIGKLEATNNKITITEAERVTEFNNIKSELTSLKDALTTINNTANSNEEVRKINENKRIAAEQQRVTDFEKIKSDNKSLGATLTKKVDDKIVEIETNNTTFKQEINEQYEDIVQENNNFKNEMNESYGNAKTDYFGEEHLNVVDRLNSDFDNVHQRINGSNYLAYEGTNIKADNSYYSYTREMSVKGRTLQNLCDKSKVTLNRGCYYEDGAFRITTDCENLVGITFNTPLTKTNNDYTIIIDVVSLFNATNGIKLEINNGSYAYIDELSLGINIFKITTGQNFTGNYIKVLRRATLATEGEFKFKNIMLLEGDYTNTPLEELPFIEGIYSVGENEENLIRFKSIGKNLFKFKDVKTTLGKGVTCEIDDDLNFALKSDTTCNAYPSAYLHYDRSMFQGKTLTFSCEVINNNPDINITVQVYYTNSDGKIIYIPFGGRTYTHTFSKYIKSDTVILQLCLNNTNTSGIANSMIISKIMCEEKSIKTEYEPYKESTQELQLTEPLRSLPNGVCDEITEDGTEIKRVGKIVLDGSENWEVVINSQYTNNRFRLSLNGKLNNSYIAGGYCDTIPFYPNKLWNIDTEMIEYDNIRLSIRKPFNNVSELQQWLQSNPTTVYYELAEPIITKHNVNMNLKTYDGTTHITSDNYLKPTISCKVPSNVQATIMNLKEENEALNDIISLMSLENEEIKTVNEAQDELIDVSLCATDEMFIMLEPILEMLPQTINLEREREVKNHMVDLYVAMVMRGLKTIEEVPARYREQVKEILAQLEK